jgi:hypothetical protein
MKIHISLQYNIMKDFRQYVEEMPVYALFNPITLQKTFFIHKERFINDDDKTFMLWAYNIPGWLTESNDEFNNAIEILHRNSLEFSINQFNIVFSDESYFWLLLKTQDEILILT